MYLIVRSKRAIILNFWVDFRKCNILHFPTNGHPWGRLEYDVHEKLQPIAFIFTTANFDEIEDEHQKLSSDKGVGSV